MSALSERPTQAVVGTAIPHESAALHVTGEALYTDDLVLRTKDVLHAYPVQVLYAHARVTRLQTEAALEVPGVVRVLTAADVPGVNDAGVKHDEPLFPDEIMFYGHAVCWVLGESLEAARLGAAAVEVDVEPLPSLISVREAIDANSFQGGQPSLERGDVEDGLAGATHVFSGEFEFSGQEHFYLETHCALAHCPTSNSALGSGLFPLTRHLELGVRVALGTDVGAGTGFSLLKEGLQAYFVQQLLGGEGLPLTSSHLLHLATSAGADALGLSDDVGDFSIGKRFDAAWLRPRTGTTLDVALRNAAGPEDALAKAFALGTPADIERVWIDGQPLPTQHRHDEAVPL